VDTERRNFSRGDCEIDATLEYAGQEFVSELINLSLSGAQINTAASPRKGELIAITFSATEEDEAVTIRCIGRVVRADIRGVGIRFEQMSMESLRPLRRLVEAHCDDPALVAEELNQFLAEVSEEVQK
jgi:hypothetical protein